MWSSAVEKWVVVFEMSSGCSLSKSGRKVAGAQENLEDLWVWQCVCGLTPSKWGWQ